MLPRAGIVGKWGLGNFGTTGYPLAQGFDYYVGQDTQVGCHDWYPLAVCNNSVHESPINTKADLVFGRKTSLSSHFGTTPIGWKDMLTSKQEKCAFVNRLYYI